MVRADRERERGLLVVELVQDRINRSFFFRRTARRFRHLGAAHAFGVDVVAEAQEHRRAQRAVVGPVLELHLRHDLRRNPDRRVRELGLLGERA